MSIERDRDGRKTLFIATCDICGAELKPEYEWRYAVDAKNAAGWKARKTANGWEDLCPDCQSRKGRYER